MTDAEIQALADKTWDSIMTAVHWGDGYTSAHRQLESALRKVAGRVTRVGKQCAGCQTSFLPRRKDALYCSDACKQRAYRARR